MADLIPIAKHVFGVGNALNNRAKYLVGHTMVFATSQQCGTGHGPTILSCRCFHPSFIHSIHCAFFTKKIASFWCLPWFFWVYKRTCQSTHTHNLEIDMHFDLWRKKTMRQLTCWKLKWHVLLGMWHWGDILEENVDINWHYFCLKTSCDTLELKLGFKWNLSNIQITPSILREENCGNKGLLLLGIGDAIFIFELQVKICPNRLNKMKLIL